MQTLTSKIPSIKLHVIIRTSQHHAQSNMLTGNAQQLEYLWHIMIFSHLENYNKGLLSVWYTTAHN